MEQVLSSQSEVVTLQEQEGVLGPAMPLSATLSPSLPLPLCPLLLQEFTTAQVLAVRLSRLNISSGLSANIDPPWVYCSFSLKPCTEMCTQPEQS